MPEKMIFSGPLPGRPGTELSYSEKQTLNFGLFKMNGIKNMTALSVSALGNK